MITSSSARFARHSPTLIVVGSMAAYAAAVLLLHERLGLGLLLFVALPVMIAGWTGGTAAGAGAALFAGLVLNPLLRLLTLGVLALPGWIGVTVLLLIGLAAGRLSEQQRRLHAQFRALIEHAADLVIVVDLADRVSFVSPSVTRTLGYTAEEAIGRRVGDFVHPDDLPHIVAAFAHARERAAPHGVECRVRRSDGGWCLLEVKARRLDGSGGLRGVVVNARDLTERRQLEEQLRQSQKMEAIGRLAGGVAHDFNNLLTAIRGNAEMLLLDAEDDDQRLGLQEITRTADRASGLTRQLLAFSRKQVLQPKLVSLNATIDEIAPMLRRLIGADVELRVALDSGLGAVRADPGQVEQVVVNLAVNARDAMPHGGKLTIETANVELDEAYVRTHVEVVPGSYVMLAVTDTGEGMDEQTRIRIFEPFFTTKEQGKGTGLGLSTVYGIVKQSGGHVWVYSELGRGTSFKIYLPRADVAPDAAPAQPPADEPLAGTETVLLVEDEPAVRELMQRVLERSGYRVLLAADASEALEVGAALTEPPDLLITDVVMPGRSGRELAELLRNRIPQLQVLYTSGYTDDAIVHHGVLEAGVHFLQKPFRPDALTRKVRELLDEPRPVGR